MDLGSLLRGLPGGQVLNGAKDRLLAKGAMAHFNKLIERYGTVVDLQLNTVDRSLSFDIHVREYHLETTAGKSVLVLDGHKIETSREWLSELIRDRVGQKEIVVPENFGWVVQLLS